MVSELSSDFALGHWIVRPEQNAISDGDHVAHVKPKSMAVLERLAQAKGSVVSRRELFDAVWPGGVVSDDVLTHCVVELRKAFGDSAREPVVIKTIPKKGFQLLLPVQQVDTSLHPRAASPLLRPSLVWSLIIIVGVAAMATWLGTLQDGAVAEQPARTKSIVVLPFVDMSSDRDQEYFADGLSEELITALAPMNGLDVIARSSAFFFKDKDEDLGTLRELLGVTHVLKGSVRREQEQLRITVQLIDASSGVYLWSDTFDQPITNLFSIQQSIAESVATALSIRLGVGELAAKPVGSTNNVAAYDAVLQGLAASVPLNSDSAPVALSHFKRATELDPNYAFAWAKIAEVYTTQGFRISNEDEFNQWKELGREAVARANKLAPGSPAVKVSSALQQIARGRWREAERTLAAAGPERADNYELTRVYIDLLIKTGRTSKAMALTERLRRLDPLNAGLAVYLANLYATLGQTERALRIVEDRYQTGEGRAIYSVQGLTIALNSSDSETIRTWLQRSARYAPGPKGIARAMAARFDDRTAALNWLHDSYPSIAGKTTSHLNADYLIAVFAAYYGDHELALRTLARSADTWSVWQPFNDELRRSPAFAELVDELGLVDYWQDFGWGDYCQPSVDRRITCR